MIDINFLIKKNPAFSIFNIKEADFVFEADPVLDEKRGVIYIIVNLKNGMVYVGLSTGSFNERYRGNWSKNTRNEHLFKAARKYGKNSFGVLIMETCRGLNVLNILETYYIAKFKSNDVRFGYNKTSGGDSYFFSPDTIEKMRLSSPLLGTKEDFISSSLQQHGDKFDYSEVIYVNRNIKVKIYCKACSKFFFQSPGSHRTTEIACPSCIAKDISNRCRMPFSEFRKRSLDKYGPTFNFYPETFSGIHNDVKFTHTVCGRTFETNAQSHLVSATGCPYCGHLLGTVGSKRARAEKSESLRKRLIAELNISDLDTPLYHIRKMIKSRETRAAALERKKQQNLEKFNNIILSSKALFGDGAFEYLGCDFNNRSKITLRCNNCSMEFKLRIDDHLNGRGCRACSMRTQAKERSLTFDEFYSRSVAKHGDSFEYFPEDYINAHTPTLIKHKICGQTFKQTPNNHGRQGCNFCRKKQMAEKISRKVIVSNGAGFYQEFNSIRNAEAFFNKGADKPSRALSKQISYKGPTLEFRGYNILVLDNVYSNTNTN